MYRTTGYPVVTMIGAFGTQRLRVLEARHPKLRSRKTQPAVPMKYEYWKSKQNSNWYWHLKAANGERIAQGEGYTTKANCLAAIKLIKSSGAAPEINLTPNES